MYDLIIIGGGPAGIAAGVYASRKQLKTLFVAKDWGGQSIVSSDIQNWIGTPHISGDTLAKNLKTHLFEYADDIVTIREGHGVANVTKDGGHFSATLDSGETFNTRAVLIATGSKRRTLSVPGADVFEHKGLTYCASCDGPLFSGSDVVVIGGGNAGFETAAQLLAYAKSVTLLHHRDSFKADPVTVERVLAHPHMKALTLAKPVEIIGDTFVNGIVYEDSEGVKHTLNAAGIFVEIGVVPNTELVTGLIELDEYMRIKIDPWTQRTNVPGVWAAGDCTNVKFHQNNISAGDGVRALEDIYITLKTT
jgi:alkyl hydroperoxide reductase subunit F